MFSVWSFVLLCRPQDYLSFLGVLRPGVSLGLITMCIYFFSAKKNEKISNNIQFRLYIFLIMVMFIGVPFSYYRSASLKDVFDYASVITIFFLLFYQIVNTISKLRRLLFVYSLGVALYCIYILNYGDFSGERIAFGSMFDANDTAFYIIAFLPFNLLFISKDNKGITRIVAVINIILSLIVMLKTGSRGGLLALISISFYLLSVKTISVRLSFIKKTALVLVAIMALQFVNMNSERYKTLLDMKGDYNVTDEEGRLAIWKMGMRMMLSHPLTGVGVNRFNEGVGYDRERRGVAVVKWQTAHNSLVQIGAETGVLGLILFCMMSLNVFKITRLTIDKSRSEELVKIAEIVRVGFIGLFISIMFISQAYSIYWAFYIVLSSVLKYSFDKESNSDVIDTYSSN